MSLLILLTMIVQSFGMTKIEVQTGPCLFQFNEPCEENKNIKFYLYTGSQNDPKELDLKNTQYPKGYDYKRQLKVLIHGYDSITFLNNVLTEYRKLQTHNILSVNWERLANKPCYVSAAANTLQVGKCIAVALNQLMPSRYTHLVGFSLGAHVAGFASNILRENYGKNVDRITGLDPAAPLFMTPFDQYKLDEHDADFVDVIHTGYGMFGKLEPSGTVDLYVNESPIQPGCTNSSNLKLCSHKRSTEIFAESITSSVGFYAHKCASFLSFLTKTCDDSPKRVLMGEYINTKTKGIFEMKTNDAPPYALG